MGVLYRARDTRLERTVAIKLLRPEAMGSEDRQQRFIREARAASALNHPHIITIYEIDRANIDGVERDFIVMEYVGGTALDEKLAEGRVPMEETVRYAGQIADALAAAHEAGIVHRDIKPANVMLTDKGLVKVLDFGLAKLLEPADVDESAPTLSVGLQTGEGVVMGTAAYMSPEQAEGRPVDARSDVFSLGVLLYELLTGKRPFQGDSIVSTRVAILQKDPPPPRTIEGSVPAELERIVLRCLQKDRTSRYASAKELSSDLERHRTRHASEGVGLASVLLRPRILVPAGTILIALAVVGGWLYQQNAEVRWAREVALPEIEALVETNELTAAYLLAEEVQQVVPADPDLARLWKRVTLPISIETDPSGADIYWKDYTDVDGEWHHAGISPMEETDLPASFLRWKFEKDGYASRIIGHYAFDFSVVPLQQDGTGPKNMVRVPGGTQRIGSHEPVTLADYWLDQFEVTNRQYKAFVDAGGYEEQVHWKHPFVEDGIEVSWNTAMAKFVDTTARPGPATWELGSYPEGEEDFPVRGVSWYEATAYAEFADKSLPTVYHWLHAIDPLAASSYVEASNFSGEAPARVGSYEGIGPYGTYDMAGNVKEWSANASADKHYILGGAWTEPVYMATERHAQPSFDRSPTHGFRCAKYDEPPSKEAMGSMEKLWRDYASESPVDDAIFDVYRSIYAYDRTKLDVVAEPLESQSSHWTKERITLTPAGGSEPIIAYLYLPANAEPPYQTVVFFPGSDALVLPQHDSWGMQYLDFIVRSGRALLHPIYRDTYERRPSQRTTGARYGRDLRIHWYQELARSVDYLETRADIDANKLAYYGLSLGAGLGPIFTALETRFEASVLFAGGFSSRDRPDEVDVFNFAPRVTMPTLVLNGRDDFSFPLESSQRPLFETLGTPQEHKRHAIIDGGHIPARVEVIKEVLPWLDRYLGPATLRRTDSPS